MGLIRNWLKQQLSWIQDKIIPRALGWYLGIEKDEDAESDAMSGAPENDDFDEEDEDDDSE